MLKMCSINRINEGRNGRKKEGKEEREKRKENSWMCEWREKRIKLWPCGIMEAQGGDSSKKGRSVNCIQ